MSAGDANYVVLSDLHLGAAYSVLTGTTRDGAVDPSIVSPALAALRDALHATIPRLYDRPVRLLLLGDCMDFSFATARASAQAFATFVSQLLSDERVFENAVVYVPGNHDHRIWREIAEQLDRADGGFVGPTPVTPLFEQPHLASPFVDSVLHQMRSDIHVTVAYPNLGYRTADRVVVFHHGHYIEPIYRAKSLIDQLLGYDPPDSAAALEQENGPWIDFVWSALGDSGNTASAILNLFETSQDATATNALVNRLTSRLTHLAESQGISRATSVIGGFDFRQTLRAALGAGLGRTAELERMSYDDYLSRPSVDGLSWFLDSIVCPELDTNDIATADLTFVFGHTHKPFRDQFVSAPFKHPISVVNTGGWVVDEPERPGKQGAAVVWTNAALETASVNVFSHPTPATGLGASESFQQRVDEVMTDPGIGAQWKNLRQAATQAVAERQRRAEDRVFDRKRGKPRIAARLP